MPTPSGGAHCRLRTMLKAGAAHSASDLSAAAMCRQCDSAGHSQHQHAKPLLPAGHLVGLSCTQGSTNYHLLTAGHAGGAGYSNASKQSRCGLQATMQAFHAHKAVDELRFCHVQAMLTGQAAQTAASRATAPRRASTLGPRTPPQRGTSAALAA